MPLSAQVIDHFQNPRNAGTLECPPAVRVETSNPACGDILRLYATSNEDGRVEAVRYQVRGCTASIAAGSVLTELIMGRSASELRELHAARIEERLGGLDPASKHAAVLCADGARLLAERLS